MFVNLRAGRLVQGGSTLTQQVAKNLFLTNARTFRRKVQELMLTLWLEHTFTKREILEIWLNRVYLGSGTWGMDAAARMYFGVSARKLNLWQCAVLAGIPRAPSRFNPRVDQAAAAARGRQVLQAMVETGAITAAQAQAASAQIAFSRSIGPAAGWFADWAAEQAQAVVPPGADATLRTTLDPRLQMVAEQRLAALLDGPGAKANAGEGAVVVLDAASGAVRAMVGGRDYHDGSYNRAVEARRQPGSSFKPFVWLAALEKGARPDDMVSADPIRVGGYSPSNDEPGLSGNVTMEDGLARSLNTVSVRLLLQAGGPADGGGSGAPAGDRGCPAGQRVPGAGHRRGWRAGDGRRLRRVLQWRVSGHAGRDGGSGRGQSSGRPAAPGADSGHGCGSGRHDGADDGGRGQPRYGTGGGGAGPRRCRQDRHDPGFSRRLVHRRGRSGCHRRLAGQR